MPRRSTSVPVPVTVTRPLNELSQFLSAQGIEIVLRIHNNHVLAFEVISDLGRYPFSVDGVHYETIVKAEQLAQAGFSVNTIATLFDRRASTTLKNTRGLFWFDADGHKIWGCHATRWYFVEGIPNEVFGH
jgi:hypothetical protein